MENIKLIFLLVLLPASIIAYGQGEYFENRQNVQLILKAGLNYSNVYNEKSDEFRADTKAGFAGGAALRIPIGRFLGVQPEALFSQKGFKGAGTLLGSQYHFTRTTSYLDFPLQLAVKPVEFLTLVAGPQYSYLIKQTDEFTNTLTSFTQEEEFKNDNIRKNILGFVMGIDINLRPEVFSVRAGWDMLHNKGDGTSNTPQYKNAWIQGTLGLSFQ